MKYGGWCLLFCQRRSYTFNIILISIGNTVFMLVCFDVYSVLIFSQLARMSPFLLATELQFTFSTLFWFHNAPWAPLLSLLVIFTSRSNLNNLICKSKLKLLPNRFAGMYQLDCTCHALNIDKTKNKVITRTIENYHDSFSWKWQIERVVSRYSSNWCS